jgi:hypothetical protein
MYWNLFKLHIYVTLGFKLQIVSNILGFITHLSGIIFNLFYLVECEMEA